MNFASLFSLFSVFCLGSVFSNVVQTNKGLAKKTKTTQSPCTAKLAEIVYYPNIPAFKYLESLMTEFQTIAQSALQDYSYFPQQGGAIADFMQKYQITILLTTPFGGSVRLSTNNGVYRVASSELQYWHALAQSNLLGYAYGYDADNGAYGVTFSIINDNTAQTTLVTILLPAQNFTPNICSK